MFRLIGGKISKVNPVVLRTPTASIGVRGSSASIKLSDKGNESTAVFMFGKYMTVKCLEGGCKGESQTATRSGSAITFNTDTVSAPILASAKLIKEIQTSFEKTSDPNEVNPSAGGNGNQPRGLISIFQDLTQPKLIEEKMRVQRQPASQWDRITG